MRTFAYDVKSRARQPPVHTNDSIRLPVYLCFPFLDNLCPTSIQMQLAKTGNNIYLSNRPLEEWEKFLKLLCAERGVHDLAVAVVRLAYDN